MSERFYLLPIVDAPLQVASDRARIRRPSVACKVEPPNDPGSKIGDKFIRYRFAAPAEDVRDNRLGALLQPDVQELVASVRSGLRLAACLLASQIAPCFVDFDRVAN